MIRQLSCRIAARPRRWRWGLVSTLWLVACDFAAPPDEPLPPEAVLEKSQERASGSKPAASKTSRSVTYTIARGGTLLNVANLYKLYHHEITALNPEISPALELEPNTNVVVFRDTGHPSESIGYPHDGQIANAWPMPDGPGRKITAERWKTWATKSTVEQLDRVLARWSELEPKAPPVLIGNLSARGGGPVGPHKSHQSGRDVDLSYITKWNGKDPVMWQSVTAENLDPELTWRLIKLITQEAEVEVIFMDRKVQKLLLAHAERHGTIRKARLGNWLEVASDARDALIRHVAGHQDHFHVRFTCPAGNRKCRS